MSDPTMMVPVEHWCVDRGGQPIIGLLDGVPVWSFFAAEAGNPGTIEYHVCDHSGRPMLNDAGDNTITGTATGKVEIYRYPTKPLAPCGHSPEGGGQTP